MKFSFLGNQFPMKYDTNKTINKIKNKEKGDKWNSISFVLFLYLVYILYLKKIDIYLSMFCFTNIKTNYQ